MKETIRRRALELGFDDCRFTDAAMPANSNRFQTWLAEKRHGEMHWLERTAAKRLEPQKVLPGANSIICLAASYGMRVECREASQSLAPQGGERVVPPRGTRVRGLQPSTSDVRPPSSGIRTPTSGLIARYARFADYHDVLGKRLKELAALVYQLGGAETRSLWYVDTGPLLEREFAERAGLGFIGKHTNVISRKFGNWLLLAEIVTTLELEPDVPERNRCGKCTRCLVACPTNAITAPFQLDARRCISYLTIELKGAIPLELRPAVGNRIFGCDDCLAVCPWNRFAREGKMMKAHLRSYQSVKNERAPSPLPSPPSQGERVPAEAGEGEIDLIELLQLDEAGFKSRFAGTPILRTKRRGLLRNVCVALGNVGNASALPHLQKAAGDPEPLIAGHARWAIERIRSRENRP